MRRLIGALAATLALDAATKALSSALLAGREVKLGRLVELKLTRNDGMALGLFSGNQAAGVLLPVAVILCGWLLMRRYRTTAFTQTACGLVLGGFLGNFLQRLYQGWVLDMIYFPFLPWFVCNVADIAICAGVTLMAASLLFRPQDWKEAKDDAKDNGGGPGGVTP